MKKIICILIVLAVAFFFFTQQKDEKIVPTLDIKNGSYVIDGDVITLKSGFSEEEIAPDSASKLITRYFGNEAEGDVNGDGLLDIAFILTQDMGGSGTFYYVTAALQGPEGYVGTNAILLGDRIAPQTTEIRDGIIIVNYADRKEDEVMSTKPSLGVSLYASLNDNNELEVLTVSGSGEHVLWGSLVMGHEARTFTPCEMGGEALWVLGSSSSYKKLLDTYTVWSEEQSDPYAKLFVVLTGEITDAPTDGFGRDYDYGVDITELVKIIPNGACK